MESGAPGAIRTHDRLLRRQMLYPTELRAQPDKLRRPSSAKVKSIFGKPRRHIPSGNHYARWRAKGKFIRKSLKTCALGG
jgi:hypothetical protein